MDWVLLRRRPDLGVGINDCGSSQHALTPPEVRKKFRAALPSVPTVVWRDAGSGTAGVISDHGEIAWVASRSQVLVLRFRTPGRGCGWIYLQIEAQGQEPIVVAFSRRHQTDYLAWTHALADAIARVTASSLEVQDEGCDA